MTTHFKHLDDLAEEIVFESMGVCAHCRYPSHLVFSFSLQYLSCPKCMVGRLERHQSDIYFSWHRTHTGASDEWRSDLATYHSEFVTKTTEILYDNRTELLSAVPSCTGCRRPLLDNPTDSRWNTVEAVTATGVAPAHQNCTATMCEHDDCLQVPHLTNRHRAWYPASSYPNHFHSIYESDSIIPQFNIQGRVLCPTHAEEIFSEYGGENEFRECGGCNTLEANSEMHYHGNYYCGYCWENRFIECRDCDVLYYENDDHWCENERDEDGSYYIQSYTYKPQPCFFGEKDRFHLGFELEIEARNNNSPNECAEKLHDILGGRAYFKHDGSLNNGFEIVTHPHTLSGYRDGFQWEALDTARTMGFRSWDTDTCGLHVHVSRDGFGNTPRSPGENENEWRKRTIIVRQSHELRFIKLIYDNQRQVERLAGRKANQWATFSDKGKLIAKVKDNYQSDGRYSVVNTENYNTIEVRIFKGSLKKERIQSALEFVHASVEYTRNLRVTGSNRALSWIKFSAYVADNMNTYPNLFNYMEKILQTDSMYDNRTEGDEN